MSVPTSGFSAHEVAVSLFGYTDASEGFSLGATFGLEGGGPKEDLNDAIVAGANAMALYLTSLGWTVDVNTRQYSGRTTPISN